MRHHLRVEVTDSDSAPDPEAMVAACAYALHKAGIPLVNIEYLGVASEVVPREVTGRDGLGVEGG